MELLNVVNGWIKFRTQGRMQSTGFPWKGYQLKGKWNSGFMNVVNGWFEFRPQGRRWTGLRGFSKYKLRSVLWRSLKYKLRIGMHWIRDGGSAEQRLPQLVPENGLWAHNSPGVMILEVFFWNGLLLPRHICHRPWLATFGPWQWNGKWEQDELRKNRAIVLW